MKTSRGFALLGFLFLAASAPPVLAAGESESTTDDIGSLRQELEAMRSEYEARIADLEQRLEAAEQSVKEANATVSLVQDEVRSSNDGAGFQATQANTSAGISVSADSSFNPAIGVSFQGQAWSYKRNPDSYDIPGFPLGGEAGLAPEGFSLAETEINIAANVDDKFTSWLTMPVVVEDGETHVEIEEAWIETLKLPAGLSMRMGRTYSNIGYLNSQHSHAWDFTDQPLVYQAFLGNQYLDDGLQVRWLAPTDLFTEVNSANTSSKGSNSVSGRT